MGLKSHQFDPRKISSSTAIAKSSSNSNGGVKALKDVLDELDKTEGINVVIMVGPPASGKSTLAKTHLAQERGYQYVNQDTLKTRKKCENAFKLALEAGESVVIDNTNADQSIRSVYISIVKHYLEKTKSNVKVHCIYLNVTTELAQHNNAYRAQTEQTEWFKGKAKKGVLQSEAIIKVPSAQGLVPMLAFHGYYSRLQIPGLKEGFDHIHNLEFEPKFETKEQEDRWRQFYI